MRIHDATHKYEQWLGQQTPLVEADLELKHRKMSGSPFAFLRATFYRWLQLWPEAFPDLVKAPEVLSVGDLHIENFGTWRDAETRLIWGINDFDEAYPAPYTHDLVRLATSACLADESEELAVNSKVIAEQILLGYSDCLARGGNPFVLEENHAWLRDIAYGELRDPVRFWTKMNAQPVMEDPLPPEAQELLESSLPERKLPYTVVLRSAGLGSLGRRRFTALADWYGSRVAREVKARVPSACAWAWGGDAGKPYHEEIVASALRVHDPTFSMTKGWTVRRLAPHCSKIEIASLSGRRDEEQLLYAMGWELGNVHLGSKESVNAVRQHLAGLPGSWLREAAKTMRAAVQDDFEDWE